MTTNITRIKIIRHQGPPDEKEQNYPYSCQSHQSECDRALGSSCQLATKREDRGTWWAMPLELTRLRRNSIGE